jgi:hypothetical protein
MIYAQGFYHLDECARAESEFAPCGCDLLELQAKSKAAVEAAAKAAEAQNGAPLVVDGIQES